jgi:integrase
MNANNLGLASHPWPILPQPRRWLSSNMATRALTQEEQASMLAAFNSTRDRLLFLAGVYTGFRIHELLSLRIGHVWRNNESAREINLARQHLKGGASAFARRVRSRTVPVHPVLQAAVQNYIFSRYPDKIPPSDDCLFLSPKGANRPISAVQAFRIIQAAARQAGNLERVATHSMRKTFARSIYDQTGHDIILTPKALGHSSVLTTSHYLESSRDAVTAAIMNLPTPAVGLRVEQLAMLAV